MSYYPGQQYHNNYGPPPPQQNYGHPPPQQGYGPPYVAPPSALYPLPYTLSADPNQPSPAGLRPAPLRWWRLRPAHAPTTAVRIQPRQCLAVCASLSKPLPQLT